MDHMTQKINKKCELMSEDREIASHHSRLEKQNAQMKQNKNGSNCHKVLENKDSNIYLPFQLIVCYSQRCQPISNMTDLCFEAQKSRKISTLFFLLAHSQFLVQLINKATYHRVMRTQKPHDSKKRKKSCLLEG